MLQPKNQLRSCQPDAFSMLSISGSVVGSERSSAANNDVEDTIFAEFFGEKVCTIWVVRRNFAYAHVFGKHGDIYVLDLDIWSARKENLVSAILDRQTVRHCGSLRVAAHSSVEKASRCCADVQDARMALS